MKTKVLRESIGSQVNPAVLFTLMIRNAKLVEPAITYEKKPTVMKFCKACNGMMPHTVIEPRYCVVCGPKK